MLPSSNNHANHADEDYLVIEILSNQRPIDVYACLRKEYSKVKHGGRTAFKINSQTISTCLPPAPSNSNFALHVHTFSAQCRYYVAQTTSLQQLGETIEKLGITLSPSIVKEILFRALYIEDDLEQMKTDGRLRFL
jgi:hypothetical protein